jgi:hypothetical protein
VRQAFLYARHFFGAHEKAAHPAQVERAIRPTNSTIQEGKTMRKALSVALLVFAFCCPVAAGLIHNPPPEPLLKGTVQLTADAETPGAETAALGVSDSLTEITLKLLAVLPALF